MSTEQILRWLVDFGTDWVDIKIDLEGTWAMDDILLFKAEMQGDLELNDLHPLDAVWKARLTKKALKRLEKGIK